MLTRPLMLVDIDGVLNPHVSPGVAMPSHYAAHQVGGQRLWLAQMHGEWLQSLSELFDLAWATTWEADANELIGPIIGAPRGLPTIHFDQLDARGWTWKPPRFKRLPATARSRGWTMNQVAVSRNGRPAAANRH